jgi:hypothetical protein
MGSDFHPWRLPFRYDRPAKLVNSAIMTASPTRADPLPDPGFAPIAVDVPEYQEDTAFDPAVWNEPEPRPRGAGGRRVLGIALAIASAVWLGYAAWTAGRTLGATPLTSPALAQWIAVATGPLALMGLIWLMFGRTRRREAEAFTRSVVSMRQEAGALQDVLAALSRQIEDNHRALGLMAGDLMNLGDEAASRLGSVTGQLQAGSAELARHGDSLDRAAAAARTDIGVLLADLPVAEESAARMAQTLREAAASARDGAAGFERQVEGLTARTHEADAIVGEAASRLVTHLTHIESAGAAAAQRLAETSTTSTDQVDAALARASEALDAVRSGIDQQSLAIGALLEQARAGIGRAGIEAADGLHQRMGAATEAVDGLTARLAEQERSSQRLVAELERGLVGLDSQFASLAETGDARAQRIAAQLGQLRGELAALGADSGAQDQAMLALADRTAALREGVSSLGQAIALELSGALHEAESGAERLLATSSDAHPLILAARDAAVEAGERIAGGANAIGAQNQALAELNAALDSGIGGAEARLDELSRAIGAANAEAQALSGQTGPALVDALLQVREAASHAADRARHAISEIIPSTAAELGEASRSALVKALRETVAERLGEVDRLAARAIDSAREASDRLTQQMLSIGQSAVALDDYLEKNRAAERRDDGEDFTRRVSLLLDSMHSASIDVQKILSDEIDEKAWGSYLKGNRGVFTRRAARLIGGTETRALAAHYEGDSEFQQSVNSFVHDFEAMLRRILAERDGGLIAVTLMSSDIGKLYAALSPVIERRR